jgi:sugar lactone lactonase YvrE
MAWDQAPGAGTLYRIAPDASWRVVLESLTISNGIGWNAAGDTMYYVDSTRHALEAFDCGPDGSITGRRVVAEVPEGFPDGLCVDDEDHVWLAIYGAGSVVRFTPTGERVATVRVPATQATSCCFAGADLDTLVITSAGEKLGPVERHDTHAGAVFAADVGVRGRPANVFG